MVSRLKRLQARRDTRGAAAVEFALVVPIFVWLILGLIQYGFYFFAMQSGTAAVGDVTRRMSVGDCQTSSAAKCLLYSKLGAATVAKTSSGITVTPTYTKDDGTTSMGSPGQIGGVVTLTATFPTVNLHFPLIPVPSGGNVTRKSTARIEDITAIAGGCS